MAKSTDSPVTVEYYYRVKWGHQQEFIDLFRKNHYPILAEQVKSGRLLKFEAWEPRFHGDGRSDWTFMTVIVYKNWQAFGESGSAEVIRRLYPDQETYKREEQRRFEILDAHWDVPLKPAMMD